MKKELLKGLSDEQIAKARACKSQEELLALAKEEGIELTDEQLASVSGAGFYCRSTPDFVCPKCNSKDVSSKYNENSINEWYTNTCKKCGYRWNVDA